LKPVDQPVPFQTSLDALLHFATAIAHFSDRNDRKLPVNSAGIEVPTLTKEITFGYPQTWYYSGSARELTCLRRFESYQSVSLGAGRVFNLESPDFRIALVKTAGLSLVGERDREALEKMPMEILELVIRKAVSGNLTFKDAALSIAVKETRDERA